MQSDFAFYNGVGVLPATKFDKVFFVIDSMFRLCLDCEFKDSANLFSKF